MKSITDSKYYLVGGMALIYGLIVVWMIVSDDRREASYRSERSYTSTHANDIRPAYRNVTSGNCKSVSFAASATFCAAQEA